MSYCKYFIGKFNEAVIILQIMLQNDSSVDHTGRAMTPFVSLSFYLNVFAGQPLANGPWRQTIKMSKR